MSSREEQPLVKVASAGNQALAEMWREVLRNNGIPALVRINGPLTAYAAFASPHDILVLTADVESARELLAAYNDDERDLALGREDDNGDEDEDGQPYWMAGAEEEEPQ